MTMLKRHALAAVGFILLSGTFAALTPAPAEGQKKASETLVVNDATSPVPVTTQGTTAVSGTVAIGNIPTVGLSPGASVAISNSPTVGLAAGSAVTVANTAAAPIPVTSVDEAGRQIVQIPLSATLSTTSFGEPLGPIYFVPAGKRLVIEHASGAAVNNGTGFIRFEIDTSVNGVFASHWLVSQSQGGIFYAASEAMRIYADPGSQLQVLALRGTAGATAFANVTLSGFLVDVP